MDVLSSVVSSPNLTSHEYHETVGPAVEAESKATSSDPALLALDAAHTLAFHSGLGNPLFTPVPQGSLSVEDVRDFANKAFTKENVVALGHGISTQVLSSLVQKGLSGLRTQSGVQSIGTKYYGGETRIETDASTPTVFIGFGTDRPSAGLGALAAYLDPTPLLKWTKGRSPLAEVGSDASVRVVHETYSDGALVGVLVQGRSGEAVRDAGKVVVEALKSAGELGKEGWEKAVRKAQFRAASALEGQGTSFAAVASEVRGVAIWMCGEN